MKLRNQSGTTATCSSNSFVYIDVKWLLIFNPVILNKEESFVFNAIMCSDQEKKTVMAFCELKSVISLQQRFRMFNNKDPPLRNNKHRWSNHFINTGSVKNQPRKGRPPVPNQTPEDPVLT